MPADDINAARRQLLDRDRHDALCRAPQLVGDVRQIASSTPMTAARSARLAGEDAFLGRDIAVHAAMPVEMVGRDVEQHRDVESERLVSSS